MSKKEFVKYGLKALTLITIYGLTHEEAVSALYPEIVEELTGEIV